MCYQLITEEVFSAIFSWRVNNFIFNSLYIYIYNFILYIIELSDDKDTFYNSLTLEGRNTLNFSIALPASKSFAFSLGHFYNTVYVIIMVTDALTPNGHEAIINHGGR